jgi:Protein of unknown function (DUF3306)
MTENFLLRWSRRKQAAAQAAEQAKCPPDAESAAVPEPAAGSGAPDTHDTSGAPQSARDASRNLGAPVFDPASLPPIESITPETDIRAFFAAGVPAELTRAALRRVWRSDPKIRDFVGLADYDWDFNSPGAMAGFGPLEGADALRAQMALRLGPDAAKGGADAMLDHGSAAEQVAPASNDRVQDRPSQATEVQIVTEDEPSRQVSGSQEGNEPAPTARENIATQQQNEPDAVQPIVRRRHGRALPDA